MLPALFTVFTLIVREAILASAMPLFLLALITDIVDSLMNRHLVNSRKEARVALYATQRNGHCCH
ncbi:hypothetical protein METHP14_880017 [Pseudomonas sp. P14-2025]